MTWSSDLDGTCRIESYIGAVAPDESIPISPVATATCIITASGYGGTATAAATVSVATPITILVEAPSAGDVIQRPDTLVRGIFTNSSGAETGISVHPNVAKVGEKPNRSWNAPLVCSRNRTWIGYGFDRHGVW